MKKWPLWHKIEQSKIIATGIAAMNNAKALSFSIINARSEAKINISIDIRNEIIWNLFFKYLLLIISP